jgi:hypothetical protein
LNNICVDPQLLNLYRTQVNPDGYRRTRNLPALRNGQPIGTAWIDSMQIAVRDRGQFMDPRSQKEWWRQYPQPGTLRLNIEHTTE